MTRFGDLLRALNQAQVNFIIIGGVAAVTHGSAHSTLDLDICYERTQQNMRNIVAALEPYHPRLRGFPSNLPFLLDARALNQGMNFIFSTDLGEIDLLGEVAGLGLFPEVARDAVSMGLYGITCRVASLEAIIRSKRAAGRPKDLRMLPELEALQDLEKDRRKDMKGFES